MLLRFLRSLSTSVKARMTTITTAEASTPPTNPAPIAPIDPHPLDLVPIVPHRSPNITIPFRHISTESFAKLCSSFDSSEDNNEEAKHEIYRRIDYIIGTRLKYDGEAVALFEAHMQGKAPLSALIDSLVAKLEERKAASAKDVESTCCPLTIP